MTAPSNEERTQPEAIAALVADLVRIDSRNPSIAAGGPGEREIADFIAGWCERAGLEVELEEALPGRPGVIATARGSGGGRSLMLNGHIDTVGTAEMEDPFGARTEDGRLYGRGAYDMKSGVAAAMAACAACAELDLAGDVVLAAVVDEEMDSTGTRELVKSRSADGAIVVEPTELTIGIAHKGFAAFEIETVGRAAHGGRPDIGIDANVLMGRVLVAIERLAAELDAGEHHPLLGAANVHASVLEGGHERTSYPGHCVLRGGRRTLPSETPESIEGELEGLLGDTPGSAELSIWKPPFAIERDHPFVATVERSIGAPIGSVFYWADSAHLDAAGIPTVLFGPAGDGAHTPVEWVDVESVHRCFEAYVAVAREWCA